jgi:hypothetical protein
VALAPAADAGKAASAAVLLGSDPKHQIVEEKEQFCRRKEEISYLLHEVKVERLKVERLEAENVEVVIVKHAVYQIRCVCTSARFCVELKTMTPRRLCGESTNHEFACACSNPSLLEARVELVCMTQ